MKNKVIRPLGNIKAIRPLGDITGDMEILMQELMYEHECQWHEVLALVHGYLQSHYPEGQETYNSDKSHPVFFYGHRDSLK